MMLLMIKRDIEPVLRRFADANPVVTITGPRQSGKTTLCRTVFPDKPYVSLEDPDVRQYAQEDPRGFISDYPTGAIFDEIQRAPLLFNYLQQRVDDAKQMGQYVLSGSQNFLLMQGITQSLAGRVAILKLFIV